MVTDWHAAAVGIGGDFVRIEAIDDDGVALWRDRPDRPAARFNRIGQNALYLSPDAQSAMVAIGGTARQDDPQRVLRRYEVGSGTVIDLRHPACADLYAIARQPWRDPLDAGEDPPAWTAADAIRGAGFDGLIDPSRRRPGLWHLILFRWNVEGAPAVRGVGSPEPVVVPPDYR